MSPPATSLLPPMGVPEGDRTRGANPDLHKGVLATSRELREGRGWHTPGEQLRVPQAIAPTHPLRRGRRSRADPMPSWPDRRAIFCLKRKRFTRGRTCKRPSRSHPHTNRFI